METSHASTGSPKLRLVDNSTCPPPCTLSVIIPLRHRPGREYVIERLVHLRDSPPSRADIEFIVIDSGSSPRYAREISDVCEGSRLRYVQHPTAGQEFAIGAARDYGVQIAHASFIMFQDVDLVASIDFYDIVINEIFHHSMHEYIREFFVVPCMYLTPAGSEEFSKQDVRTRHSTFHGYYMDGSAPEFIQAVAPSSSVMVVNRLHYLAMGGHRREFYGHGYEDFELIHRLAGYCQRYLRSGSYYKDFGNYETLEYEGFRAHFSMYGLPLLNRGIYLVHLWHPRVKTGSYESRRGNNRDFLQNFMLSFDKTRNQPLPLRDLDNQKKTLILGEEGHWSFDCLRTVLPLFGNTVYRPASVFEDTESLAKFIERNRITGLFSNNPYGDEHRLSLYRWARANGIPYLTFDRGGLPDSWFFDWQGFNADSESYGSERWDHPLDENQALAVEQYIADVIMSGETLEKNGARVGPWNLREKYKIGDRRVLFVPFQRPSDSVIKYFSGNVDGVAGFVGLIEAVAANLDPNEWIILCKKHPLETETPGCNGVVFLDEGTHVHDILDLANAVLTINSGVGLLAMLFGKRCLYAGRTYYGHPEINDAVATAADVVRILDEIPEVDRQKVLRFIHYLRFEFYSFGKAYVEEKKREDGSLRSITKDIAFTAIRGIVDRDITISYRNAPVAWNARCFGHFLPSILKRHTDKHAAAATAGQLPTSVAAEMPAVPAAQAAVDAASKAAVTSQPASAAARSSSRVARQTGAVVRKPGSFWRKTRKLVRNPLRFLTDAVRRA
jgi:predicted glycosyltransferase involved in capsule biosynthesis